MSVRNVSVSVVVSVLLSLLTHTEALSRPSDVVLRENGYENILVAIHPNTRQSHSLISEIKVSVSE